MASFRHLPGEERNQDFDGIFGASQGAPDLPGRRVNCHLGKNPSDDGLLIDRASKKKIPIIAELVDMPNQLTSVAVDNFQAGKDLGYGVGRYLREQGLEKAYLLDLTFHQPNTQLRSRGFWEGLKKTLVLRKSYCPSTLNRDKTVAHQLTYDTLTVYPQINVIFAINDTTAKGAMQRSP